MSLGVQMEVNSQSVDMLGSETCLSSFSTLWSVVHQILRSNWTHPNSTIPSVCPPSFHPAVRQSIWTLAMSVFRPGAPDLGPTSPALSSARVRVASGARHLRAASGPRQPSLTAYHHSTLCQPSPEYAFYGPNEDATNSPTTERPTDPARRVTSARSTRGQSVLSHLPSALA